MAHRVRHGQRELTEASRRPCRRTYRSALRASVHRILWLVLAIAVQGCSAESVLGPGDLLVGKWGGLGVELLGTSDGIVVTLSCGRTASTGPVRIGADKTFGGTVELRTGSSAPTTTPFSGRIVSDHSLYIEFGVPVIAYATVVEGQRAQFWSCASAVRG